MRATLTAGLLVASVCWADSPLTSIDFSNAYRDEPAVKAAKEHNLERVFSFLSGGASNDRKLAVIHALGWSDEYATGFLGFLAQQKQRPLEQLNEDTLTPSEVFVVATLVAQAHYDALEPLVAGVKDIRGRAPRAMLESLVASALKNDFTVQYELALVKAQQELTGNWCKVFTIPHEVEAAFPPAKRNLRPAALEEANGYLSGYEESCPGSKAATRKAKEELNQIYTLARLGPHILAGTQAGVVVWDPSSPHAPHAVQPGFICQGLVIGDAGWFGCNTEVVRWDGEMFTTFLKVNRGDHAGSYYHPMLGPHGEVWVRLGARTWQFDAVKKKFVKVDAPWKGDPYDAVFFQGKDFSIDFLRGLSIGGERVALKSAVYPGSDPRRFRIDDNTLWVEDFERGLYRYDGARFVLQKGLSEKASGVAVDPARHVTLLLHYTKGLVVQRSGKPDELVDLSQLENMRDLLYEPGNGDVWVAGWGQLLHLRADGEGWGRQSFRAK